MGAECVRPNTLADGVGFEPTRPLRACRFSRPVLSTAQPPIRVGCRILPGAGLSQAESSWAWISNNSLRHAPGQAMFDKSRNDPEGLRRVVALGLSTIL